MAISKLTAQELGFPEQWSINTTAIGECDDKCSLPECIHLSHPDLWGFPCMTMDGFILISSGWFCYAMDNYHRVGIILENKVGSLPCQVRKEYTHDFYAWHWAKSK